MSHEVDAEQSIEHLDFTIPCESRRCREEWARGDHDADWLMILTCNCGIHVCHDRLSHTLTMLAMGTLMLCPVCQTRPVNVTTQHRLH